MIIVDGSREYNTDAIDVIMSKDKEDRSNAESFIIYNFTRFAYSKYVQIRDITAGKRCKKMSVDDVIERIDKTYVSQFVRLNVEEIDYILSYVKLHVEIVR